MTEFSCRYQLEVHDLKAHLYRVHCEVPVPDPDGQSFRLPAWVHE